MENKNREYASSMIKQFMHCGSCMEELPEDTSPQDYVWLEVGINYDDMIQVNCIRHDIVLGAFNLLDNPIPDNHCCDCDG